MTMMEKSTAMAAIKVLAGKRFLNLDRKDAVLELLAATEKTDQQEAADETIEFLLDQFDQTKWNAYEKLEALDLALAVAEKYLPPISTAERLVATAARVGFHGCFPVLPIRLLNRPPSTDEVVSLISAYVADTACRCGATEEKLESFVRTYFPREEANAQLKRLEKFAVDWESTIDI